MSDWKGHTMFGILCTAVTLLIISRFESLNLEFIWLSIIISFLYSQLPDIDTQASKIRWILTTGAVIGALVNLVFYNNKGTAIICLGVITIIWVMGLIKGFGHRGVTHTLPAAILFSALMYYFSIWAMAVALVNYLSHLFLDTRT
jgi:membrane-bound metal-dependent hydrolase YbcI (DUF457 family)